MRVRSPADGFSDWVMNLRESGEDFGEVLVLANLLSFYQQLLLFEENQALFAEWNVERPLWVFVGHTVVASSAADRRSLSDVEQVVAFLRSYLREHETWTARIENVLGERSGLQRADGQDLFTGQFRFLQASGVSARAVYEDTLRRVFHAEAGQELRAVRLGAAPGEIGLRAGAGEAPFFGVINIGDSKRLGDLLANSGTVLSDDVFASSLFATINEPRSPVSMLIGSRRFMEGWDSFRVASMGLMNIGRGEGSQIIQLFGRGVRLWGRNRSLRRSTADDGVAVPKMLPSLETLNVFGIRADYMAEFRSHLDAEGIATETAEIELPTRVAPDVYSLGLNTLALPGGADFKSSETLRFETDSALRVSLDLRPQIEAASSARAFARSTRGAGSDESDRLRKQVGLLDNDRLYLDLLSFVQAKAMYNLVFRPSDLEGYLRAGSFEVLVPAGALDRSGPHIWERLHETASALLRKYAATLFEARRRRWDGHNVRLASLSDDHPNVAFGSYILKVGTDSDSLLQEIRSIAQSETVYQRDCPQVPTLVFDRHLFQPLVAADTTQRVRSAKPAALNDGERRFVERLRAYVETPGNAAEDLDLYLLRNLSRGRGIGFFEPTVGEGFYPDFVLWLLEETGQRIVFIDPKGLRYARQGFSDPKIALHRQLPELAASLRRREGVDVKLTSFIVSVTPYAELAGVFGSRRHTEEEFRNEHILFLEDESVAETLIEMALAA